MGNENKGRMTAFYRMDSPHGDWKSFIELKIRTTILGSIKDSLKRNTKKMLNKIQH